MFLKSLRQERYMFLCFPLDPPLNTSIDAFATASNCVRFTLFSFKHRIARLRMVETIKLP